MRKIWVRRAQVFPSRRVPADAKQEALAEAERALREHEDRRSAVSELLVLRARAGDLDGAQALAERWARKEALDPQALTARADLAARRGERDRAVRMLGSVLDVRPGDLGALQRLARLYRWWGKPARACRFTLARAEVDDDAPEALAAAVRCARSTGAGALADTLLRGASEEVRGEAEEALEEPAPPERVRGELRLEATWDGPQDVDLAMIDPNGRRVSWLGAPTRGIISASDVAVAGREQLGLLGSVAGEYVIEVVRAEGEGPVSGEILVRTPTGPRRLPFTLEGQRTTVGTVRISWTSKLVPL